LGVVTWLHLIQIQQKIGQRAARHLEQYDLTPAQFDVVAQLSVAPGISQQMLADRLRVTKGNVCGLLDRMTARNLVERRPHPEDGRSHLVYLTYQGATLAAKVVPEHEALIAEQMAALSSDDRRMLHQLLRRLDRALTVC
jgi:DNA-binding MarR family transcriptional regulator